MQPHPTTTNINKAFKSVKNIIITSACPSSSSTDVSNGKPDGRKTKTTFIMQTDHHSIFYSFAYITISSICMII